MKSAKQPVRRVAIIMAGGSGERFWPLSRQKRPKQLLKLSSETQTMLEESVSRIAPLIPVENIFIATTRELVASIRRAGCGVAPENILAEPAKRNTSGCLAWAAAQMMARFPNETVSMAVLTADHEIGAPARFRACVKRAMTAAEKERALVTIGIKPTRPETGYGYIETGRRGKTDNVRKVMRFREKPNHETAIGFVDGGHHYWNSGMFFWTVPTFVAEMAQASPIHSEVISAMAEELGAGKARAADREFQKLPNMSIDYTLLEKSSNVLMVESTFPWDDVGAWDALERSRRADANGNVSEGDPVLVDSRDCIVVNEAGADRIAVGVLGAENLVVIVTADAVLVVPKSSVQDVRRIVRELKDRKARQV